MKRFATILFLLSALVLGLLVVVNSLTSGLAKNADEFFSAVRDQRIETARNYLSDGFRERITPSEFEAWLAASSLDRYASSSWDSRTFLGSQGEIRGTIYLENGTVLPAQLVFVNQDDQWRIHSIDVALPGVTPRPGPKAIPALGVLQSLVTQTINRFGESTTSDDFDSFYSSISALWQSRTSPARLRAAFEPFIESGEDPARFATVAPVFSQPPRLDEEGRLHLTGYFPHEAATLGFDLTFTYEYPEWKLLGLNVSL